LIEGLLGGDGKKGEFWERGRDRHRNLLMKGKPQKVDVFSQGKRD
jgi:hypothetical protein